MGRLKKRLFCVLCVTWMLSFCVEMALPNGAARAETTWETAAEAEAARALIEERAREIAQEAAQLAARAEAAEAALEEAYGELEAAEAALEALRAAGGDTTAAEEAAKAASDEVELWTGRLEKVQAAVEEKNQELVEAAMALKEATEAAVAMANLELVDDSHIAGAFALGERYSGTFNENMDPIYLRFQMTKDSQVRVSTSGAKVSISVLNASGMTILTLVPSVNGNGSVCSLAEGEYTLMVATVGETKNVSVSISESTGAPSVGTSFREEDDFEFEEEDFEFEDEDIEMETLVEFD